jgi:hypothetical protein
MTDAAEKRSNFFQVVISIILTVIAILATFISISVAEIRNEQVNTATELMRIKTVQDVNTANIGTLNTRLSVLEHDYMTYIQEWVEANYVRKPQKKYE